MINLQLSQFWPLNWHLWPPVTSEQYFSARFGFPDTKKPMKRQPKVQYSRFKWLTSSWPLIMTSKWQLWLPVTSEQYHSARFGFPDTKKNLWKDTHKYKTVDFNDWPPVDLQFWFLSGSCDLPWHLSSILVQDLDSQIPKTYEKTPISPIQ